MTEQMDHRAAIEWATGLVTADQYGTNLGDANLARCYLASVKAAWPGVIQTLDVKRDGLGKWTAPSPNYVNATLLANRANKFERDYPGLKVDEPWLVTVMEGVK